jgi:hypothetical protein
MQNLWLKIKIWTKISIFGLIVLYLALFLFKNADQPVIIWFWFGKEPIRSTALEVIPVTLLIGVIGTLIVRMAFRSIRQIRELRARNAATRMTKDVEDLKTKAAMLQTKPAAPTDAAGPL